jgi:formylglycine-generating enzyme required for sulfatase activity
MRDILVHTQENNGPHAGSWVPRGGHHDSAGGRLYMTSLALCTLEVYYRHLPVLREIDIDHHRGALKEAIISLSWPLSQRVNSALWIDGQSLCLPKVGDARLRFAVPPGSHSIRVERHGFAPIVESDLVLDDGQVEDLSLAWRPILREPPPAVPPFDSAQARQHQEAWADHLGVDVEVTNSIGMKLVLIPPGEFTMGSPESDSDAQPCEKPPHRVVVSKPFFMGKHEVTVAQFRQFVDATGHKASGLEDGAGNVGFDTLTAKWKRWPEMTWRDPMFPQKDDHPVSAVSWTDVEPFCQWLASGESQVYALPTEAQWEYACRTGTMTRYSTGEEVRTLRRFANLPDQSLREARPAMTDWTFAEWDDGSPFTASVGTFLPNAFGLHDLHGNAFEWCLDFFAEDYYQQSPDEDPRGPEMGQERVIRGGAWCDPPPGSRHRCAGRDSASPDRGYYDVGFRVVRKIVVPSP